MSEHLPGCTSKSCDYAIDGPGPIGCTEGSGFCSDAVMLAAETSEFHDQTLADATAEINLILDRVRVKAKPGHKLSMLSTEEGMFIAWTDHSKEPGPNAVRRKDGHDKVKKALKIKTRGPKAE